MFAHQPLSPIKEEGLEACSVPPSRFYDPQSDGDAGYESMPDLDDASDDDDHYSTGGNTSVLLLFNPLRLL